MVVKQVLSILEKKNLYLKPEKCKFEQSTIEHLGMVFSKGRVGMDPVKVKGIAD